MAKIIVPVGFDNGPRYAADESETDHYEIIASPGQSFDLPDDAYRVWVLAFADLEAHRDLAFTRERLVKLAAAGPETPEQVEMIVEGLVSGGALAEYEPGTASALDFLRGHRLYPFAEGMGSTREKPEMFRIGRNGEVLLEVYSDIYSIWSLNLDSPDIWTMIEWFCEPPSPLTADETGFMFAQVVPTLLALRLGYLRQSS
jgi:hypothetical protein